jgi:hypothetical protein
MQYRKLLCALVLLAASLAPTFAHAQQKIPYLHGTAFSGEAVDLPAALHGRTGVLIVSFSQGSRDAVTQWFRQLAADYRTSPTVVYYELPVLAGAPGFLRGMIAKKIKETVSAPAQPRFVPIFDHEDEWKAAAGFLKASGDDKAYLLVVDSTGTIRYRLATGAPTPQTYGDLKHQIEGRE